MNLWVVFRPVPLMSEVLAEWLIEGVGREELGAAVVAVFFFEPLSLRLGVLVDLVDHQEDLLRHRLECLSVHPTACEPIRVPSGALLLRIEVEDESEGRKNVALADGLVVLELAAGIRAAHESRRSWKSGDRAVVGERFVDGVAPLHDEFLWSRGWRRCVWVLELPQLSLVLLQLVSQGIVRRNCGKLDIVELIQPRFGRPRAVVPRRRATHALPLADRERALVNLGLSRLQGGFSRRDLLLERLDALTISGCAHIGRYGVVLCGEGGRWLRR